MKLKKGIENPRLVETKPGEYTFCVDTMGGFPLRSISNWDEYLQKKGRLFIKELQGKKPEILKMHKRNFKKQRK